MKTPDKEGTWKVVRQYILFFLLIILIIVFVCAIVIVSERIREYSPLQPKLTIKTDTKSNLIVTVKIIDTLCEDTKKIDYSVIELTIEGGTPPYQMTITNSDSELYGPYVILNNNLPVRVKVYGGDFFTAAATSPNNEFWTGIIGLPSEDEYCKALPSETPEPTDTESPTITLIPTNTEAVIVEPTFTVTLTLSGNQFPDKTRTRSPGITSTPSYTQTIGIVPSQVTATKTLLGQITSTQMPTVTKTSLVQPTSTQQLLTATNTSMAQPTSTPQPLATFTSRPTNTPIPTPTLINPHPKECEDGIDNDGDGLIDYGNDPLKNDPDCKKASDPNEDR